MKATPLGGRDRMGENATHKSCKKVRYAQKKGGGGELSRDDGEGETGGRVVENGL